MQFAQVCDDGVALAPNVAGGIATKRVNVIAAGKFHTQYFQ
jgi:hypothetical protein